MKLHFLDNGYHVVGLVLAGLVLGWWGVEAKATGKSVRLTIAP